jgi:uncharacterized protein YjdB
MAMKKSCAVRTALAALGALLLWSCNREFDGPFTPGSNDYAGADWSIDANKNGISDSVEKYYPGCNLGPKACVEAAKSLKLLSLQSPSLTARDMILWKGSPEAEPRLGYSPPELAARGFTLSSTDSLKVLPRNGKLLAVEVGQASIRVEVKGLSIFSTFTAKVVAAGKPVASLGASDLVIAAGEESAPLLAWTPADAAYREYRLISDNPSVAAVAGLKVKGMAPGAAKVAAEALDGGHRAVFTVTVTAIRQIPVDSLRAEDMHLVVGDAPAAPKLTWIPRNASNKKYLLVSQNIPVAEVNAEKDRVTAKAPGTAQIVVLALDGSGKTTQFTVSVSAKTVPLSAVSAADMRLLAGAAPESPLLTWDPPDATNRNYTLQSGKPSVAEAVGGQIKPIARGEARIIITAQDGGRRDTFLVSVTAPDTTIHVDSVQVADMSLALGTERAPVVTWYPRNVGNREYTLTSLHPGIAEAVGDGVRAQAEGKATLRLETRDGGRLALFQVHVFRPDIPLASVNAQPMNLRAGDPPASPTLVWNPVNATDKKYRLASNNPLVASITGDTLVRPLVPGNAVITVTAAGGVTAEFQVTVALRIIPLLSISAANIRMQVGDADKELSLTFTPPEATYKDYIIKSSNNTAVAVPVDFTKVRAVGPGQAVITVETLGTDKLAAICTVTVVEATVTVESIGAADLSMRAGEERLPALVWKPASATDKSYTMTSSHPDVVAISGDTLSARAAGKSDVTVTTHDGGKTTIFKVTVTVPVVSISAADLTLRKGEQRDPVLTWTPADATDQGYTLASQNTTVATIGGGKVRAVGTGTAVIQVTSKDGGKTAAFSVTVVEDAVAVDSLAAADLSMRMGDPDTSPILTWFPADAADKEYSLASENTAVVSIAGNLLRAVAPGTSRIEAISKDGDKSAFFTVTVTDSVPVDSIQVGDMQLTLGEVDGVVNPGIIWFPADATNKGYTLTSKDAEVAAISGGGVVPRKKGRTDVTVTTEDGKKTAKFRVDVKEAGGN